MSIKSPINIKKIKGVKKKIIRDFRGPLLSPEEGGGGGGGGGITGLNIDLDYAGSDWGGVYQGGIDLFEKGNATNLMDSLTRVTYAIGASFSDISAGQYISGSDYNQTQLHGTEINAVHWSKTAGALHPFFIKPSAGITLDYVDLWIVFKTTFPTVTFRDQDLNVLTPTTSPATDWSDAISSGTPNTQTRQVRWIFNE